MPTATLANELLFFLVQNLSATPSNVTAQQISRSNIFDLNDELGQAWEMLHFTTQEEIACDVSQVLTGIEQDLYFLS